MNKSFALLLAISVMALSCSKPDTNDPWNPDPGQMDPRPVVAADQAVDLGLSVKWRSGNLGAQYAHERGDYYAWGETDHYYVDGDSEKDDKSISWKNGKAAGYDWASYQFTSDGGETFTKYTYNGPATLTPDDDVAHKLLGGTWRIPTKAEFEELLTDPELQWGWTNYHNHYGYMIISRKAGHNGKFIFLPATGLRYHNILFNELAIGYYWTSSLKLDDAECAHFVYFFSDQKSLKDAYYRYGGFAIRPVCD